MRRKIGAQQTFQEGERCALAVGLCHGSTFNGRRIPYRRRTGIGENCLA
jgi:hypothetical protein